jgi:tRNA(His) 5'-end guanylyltransferase
MERITDKTISLGDRIKMYERQYTSFMINPALPFIARVDGRAFHTYTHKMEKPFDARFTTAMCKTAMKLTESFSPTITYVQSDEITLLFKPTMEPPFGGKLSKLNSNIASAATYWFGQYIDSSVPTVGIPLFDCRVFNLPDEWEAVNALRFRYRDAVRNAVSAATRYKFGHSTCTGKNTQEKLQMIESDWDSYPRTARYGEFFRRALVMRPVEVDRSTLNPEVAARVPEFCMRHAIIPYTVNAVHDGIATDEYLTSPEYGIECITNMPDVLFRNEAPKYDKQRSDDTDDEFVGFFKVHEK